MSLRRSAEVAEALDAVQPVVALESTIVAHGLPWPQNLEVARELEGAVRAGGAVPATIAVIDGIARIGLTPAELERLAREGPSFGKAATTDLAVAMARHSCAATTVSATSYLAAAAGIRVFATGGIGGVHRGDAFDVSHDLVALSRIPIAVVSAGAKSLLDLPRTLEALETLGVLVLGYRCDELPAFYRRSSGLRLPHRVDTVAELAAILRQHWQKLSGQGALVANPIPSEAELPAELIDAVIEAALARAAERSITGKALTPFLLAEIAAATGGRAVAANRALAIHNASVAAALAASLAAALTER
jgi:pseudouridine-5'-phosphate glycosidase